MVELFIRTLSDLGIGRKAAATVAGLGCILFGAPSAWSLDFFKNQDWVWGIGLIISGLFFIFAVFKHGLKRFLPTMVDTDSDFKVAPAYFQISMVINILFGLVLIWWWMSRGYSDYPWFDASGNWNAIDVYSNASIVTQWAGILLLGILLNRWLALKFKPQTL